MRSRRAEPRRSEIDSALDEAAARHAPLALHRMGLDGRPVVLRTRIRSTNNDHVLLDQSQEGGEAAVHSGECWEAYFLVDGARYGFEAEVVEVVTEGEPNRVVAIVLRRPGAVRPAQRRADFRISLVAREPIVVTAHEALPDDSGACPLDAFRFDATLVDLSAGGMGVWLSLAGLRGPSVGDRLFMSYGLPDDDEEPLVNLHEVRHRKLFSVGGGQRLGALMLPWPDERAMERAQQRLRRFVTRLQRERIRRAG